MKRWLPFVKTAPLVAVIRLGGAIMPATRMGALNDQGTARMIERAFHRGRPAAIALVINSPGGSPVQSSLIAARIRRLAEERKVPVHAFVEDVAASGGYWLAVAADEIHVDHGSILGSIGAISAGFGLHDFIARHGIERRVHTAGSAKSLADPFRPEKPEDVKRLKTLLEQIHATFIDHVKARRGPRLHKDTDLFTGDIWVGQRAVEVGLADGIGHVVPKMKEILGDRTRFRLYGPRRGFLGRIGTRIIDDALTFAEERALFARFGL